ncbi:ABC transporter substrate-binding protein [Gracilibacillus kekensis]|uniref:Carbohydrate ABC transporter substrate-binding protein, CUT1 family n=1 Tax=Gracilibacillus kekensis TaxID=1027249 RepID=A0A1M7QN88_9BACI|nr:ABC transporter substrate-binding protein [Gracilibacillus kekensis]SHN32810.1 carbohydrate ABC transporter substrate-binding protein, CUT1 family [Gracilibacillus kekensis]
MKKNLKNSFTLIGVSIVIILLAACSNNSTNENQDETENDNSEDVQTIHMAKLESDPNGMMEEARQRFNEEHDEIQVEFVEMSNDASQMHDQTVTQLSAGSENLDIVNMDVVWTAEFAEAGWIEPLDEYFTEDMQSEFIERQVDAMTYDGQIWAVPWFNDLHPLWYREDLLEKHNLEIPETYEEAVEVAKTMQEEENIEGFSMHWGRAEQLIVSFTEFLHANNGNFFDEEGNVVINSPEAIEALQFMVDMIYEDEVVSPSAIGNSTPEDSRIPFTQGQVMFHPNWGYVYSVNQADDSPVKDKTWVASNFAFEGGKKANAVGGWNFAISKNASDKDTAWEVIKWFTTFENQKEMLLGGGQVGTRVALYEDEEVIEANPYLEEYLDVFEHASVRPSHPQYSKVSDIAQSYIHQALTQDLSAEEALHQLATELEELE